MTSTHRILIAVVAGIMLAGAPLLYPRDPLHADVDISAVEDAVICTCGCANMVLSTCLCGHAAEMRTEIRALYESGKNDDEVLEILISRYGERILATPKQEGFNLTAYTLPFLAILMGGGLLISLINRWKKNAGEGKGEEGQTGEVAEDDPYRRRLEEELKSYEE
jgi:cytochrome c-type biogenesis protein CcmH